MIMEITTRHAGVLVAYPMIIAGRRRKVRNVGRSAEREAGRRYLIREIPFPA
jgi:hypothetical protein